MLKSDTPHPRRLTDGAHTFDIEVQQVASGGFGVVYMGPDHAAQGNWRALKTYQGHYHQPAVREAFKREALIWNSLWPHPNLLQALRVSYVDFKLYLLLPYKVRGNLRRHLHHPHRMTTRLGWAQHIAAGLVALHTPDPTFLRPWSIVHRDLKPENVLLDDTGLLKITDFGIARALDSAVIQDATAMPADDAPEDAHGQRSRLLQTAEGHIIGTPAYMAPELWHTPRSAGTAVDIYAFGVMLYELFVQQHPLVEPDESAEALRGVWAHLHTHRTPRPLHEMGADLPPAVAALANACLAKAPEERPTAAEALTQIQSIATALGEPAYSPSAVLERTPQNKAKRLILAAVAHGSLSLPDMERAYSEQAIARCPEQASYRAVHASALRKLGKSEEALAEIERALTYVATEHDRLNTSIEYAQLLLHFGRFAEAGESYAMLVELQPKNANHWLQRCQVQIHWARSEWEHGQNEQAYSHLSLARDAIQRAFDLTPQEKILNDLLIAVHIELTEWGSGEPWMRVRFVPSKTGGVPAMQVDGRRRPHTEANQTTR